MPSILAHVAVVLGVYVGLPPPCTAFLSAPTGLSFDLQSTKVVRAVPSRLGAVSRRQDTRGACREQTGSPAKRSFRQARLVLQAATEGDNQVTDQESQQQQQQAATAAARSKQLNIACNDVVRTILDGNVSDEKAKALALRQRLEKQRDALVSPDDDMSALFFENLLLVCQHELHPDIGILKGEYGRAWHTILHYIEDAGWQLTDPPFSISG